MLPIQFIMLLIVASFPGAIGTSNTAAAYGGPFPWFDVASFFFWQLAIAGFVWSRTRKAIRALHEPSSSSSAITQHMDNLFSRARWLTIVITGFHLYSTQLPGAVFAAMDRMHFSPGPDGQFPLIPELLFILPAVSAWLVIWTAAYFLQSAARERSLPYLLARELPVHEMPTLGEYLLMQMRHNLFPVVFLFLEAGIVYLTPLFSRIFAVSGNPEKTASNGQTAAVVAVLIGAVFFVPWILVKLWSTTGLGGRLRERLDSVASRYRLRFRNILLWRTHNMVINAAILGWVPFARYFLMSDALVESMSDQQLEAVFAHEVGHGVHRHIPWYFASILGALAAAMGVTGILIVGLHAVFSWSPESLGTLGQYVSTTLCVGGVALSIAFIAPQFENQADWFACRHMGRMIREAPAGQSGFSAAVSGPGGTPVVINVERYLAPEPRGEGGAAKTVTMEQYMHGQYPHSADFPVMMGGGGGGSSGWSVNIGGGLPAAGAFGTLTQTPAGLPAGALAPGPGPGRTSDGPGRGDLADQMGTEIFISALDSIVETSQKARDQRGWMHPSINGRIALLRELAVNPGLVERFNRRMLRLRLFIAAFFIAGVGCAILANELPDPTKPPPATQTAPDEPMRPDLIQVHWKNPGKSLSRPLPDSRLP